MPDDKIALTVERTEPAILAALEKLSKIYADVVGNKAADGYPNHRCIGLMNATPFDRGITLAIRHPQIGWVSTDMSIPQAAHLAAICSGFIAQQLVAAAAQAEAAANVTSGTSIQ